MGAGKAGSEPRIEPSGSPNRRGKWGTQDLASATIAVSSQADWVTASNGFVSTGNSISSAPLPPSDLDLPDQYQRDGVWWGGESEWRGSKESHSLQRNGDRGACPINLTTFCIQGAPAILLVLAHFVVLRVHKAAATVFIKSLDASLH